MKTEYTIIILLFIHWIADFLLQTEHMAMNKSKSFYLLSLHVFIYSFTWMIIGVFFYDIWTVAKFTTVTFFLHFLTDYYTSKETTRLYKRKKYYGFPGFFPMIGLDQWLHQIQIILTYTLLIQ